MALAEKIRLSQPLRSARLVCRLKQPAQVDVAAREAEAYQKGHAAGVEHVNQQLLEQRAEMNELRAGLFRSLEQAAQTAVAEVREALPVLVLAAVRRLLGRIEINREMVLGIVEELLAEIGPEVGPVEVRLHPADLQLIEDEAPELSRNHPALRLVADEKLGRGDCRAATRFGTIDARLQNKIEKLQDSLTPGA